MSLSRRLLLFSPLAVLTLFFVALGWRNNHLSMSEDGVLLAIPNYRTSTGILAPVDILPFGDGETVALGMRGDGRSARPLTSALMKRFAALYPHMKFSGPSLARHFSDSYINFGPVEFQNRFSARCSVTHSCVIHGINHVDAHLYLTRSPVNLRDNEWHVFKVENFGY